MQVSLEASRAVQLASIPIPGYPLIVLARVRTPRWHLIHTRLYTRALWPQALVEVPKLAANFILGDTLLCISSH